MRRFCLTRSFAARAAARRAAARAAAAAAAAVLVLACGCQSSSPPPDPAARGAAPQGAAAVKKMAADAPAAQKPAGSELWAQNCTRCHYARPPEYYSDAQWDVIVHHMRLRANLTGEEARKIAEFLKSAN